jgi:hypothetical protein
VVVGGDSGVAGHPIPKACPPGPSAAPGAWSLIRLAATPLTTNQTPYGWTPAAAVHRSQQPGS